LIVADLRSKINNINHANSKVDQPIFTVTGVHHSAPPIHWFNCALSDFENQQSSNPAPEKLQPVVPRRGLTSHERTTVNSVLPLAQME